MYILEEKILPVGKKIRAIRKYLKINQEKLAGELINRSMISYIENGKVKLSRETAQVLVKNLKRVIEEKNLDLEIDADYLLADEIGQASYLLDTKIKKLQGFMEDGKLFEKELDKTEDILKNWDIPLKKSYIYEIAGDYFYKKDFIDKSKIYYLKALENYIRINHHKKIACVHTKLGRCAIKKGNNEEALHLNNYALSVMCSNNIDNKELEKRILFNNALALTLLKKYSDSLTVLDKFIVKFKYLKNSEYKDVMLLKGNNFFYLGRNNDALKIYNELLEFSKKIKDVELEARALKNISSIYYKMSEVIRSIELEEKCLNLRINIKSKHLATNMLSLAEKYLEIGKYEISQKYLLNALEKAKESKDIFLQIEIYHLLLKLYSLGNKESLRKDILDEIFSFVVNNKDAQGLDVLIFRLCNFYINEDTEKLKSLLELGYIKNTIKEVC